MCMRLGVREATQVHGKHSVARGSSVTASYLRPCYNNAAALAASLPFFSRLRVLLLRPLYVTQQPGDVARRHHPCALGRRRRCSPGRSIW